EVGEIAADLFAQIVEVQPFVSGQRRAGEVHVRHELRVRGHRPAVAGAGAAAVAAQDLAEEFGAAFDLAVAAAVDRQLVRRNEPAARRGDVDRPSGLRERGAGGGEEQDRITDITRHTGEKCRFEILSGQVAFTGKMSGVERMPFEYVGGTPALDFVNTALWAAEGSIVVDEESFKEFSDLIRWAEGRK